MSIATNLNTLYDQLSIILEECNSALAYKGITTSAKALAEVPALIRTITGAGADDGYDDGYWYFSIRGSDSPTLDFYNEDSNDHRSGIQAGSIVYIEMDASEEAKIAGSQSPVFVRGILDTEVGEYNLMKIKGMHNATVYFQGNKYEGLTLAMEKTWLWSTSTNMGPEESQITFGGSSIGGQSGIIPKFSKDVIYKFH